MSSLKSGRPGNASGCSASNTTRPEMSRSRKRNTVVLSTSAVVAALSPSRTAGESVSVDPNSSTNGRNADRLIVCACSSAAATASSCDAIAVVRVSTTPRPKIGTKAIVAYATKRRRLRLASDFTVVHRHPQTLT